MICRYEDLKIFSGGIIHRKRSIGFEDWRNLLFYDGTTP